MNDGVVASASVAEITNERFTFSAVDLSPIAASTGAWFPASITVITIDSESVATPSVARKVTGYDPACVKPGVQLNDAVPLPLFINDAPLGSVVELNDGVVPSASVADIVNARLTASVVD